MTPLLLVACSLDEDPCAALAGCGYAPVATPELYHIEEASPAWDRLRALNRPLVVVTGLQARPAEWLLRHHGLGDAGLRVVSLLDAGDPPEFARRVGEALAALGSGGSPAEAPQLPDLVAGDRWYPVHDKSRCTECGHCLQFCLFGVYETDAGGRVRVTNPDNCKPGCPACARICPHRAIMFPLYHQDPAIAGAPGQFVELDAEGRKLYYGRTGAQCPVCDQSGEPQRRRGKGETCAECGRPLVISNRVERTIPGRVVDSGGPGRPAPRDEGDADARDELDALLDELENLSGGAS